MSFHDEVFVPFGSGPKVLMIEHWMKRYPQVVAGFTTRIGGKSDAPYSSFNCGLHVGDHPEHVKQNRKDLVKLQGFTFEQWLSANQVHHHHLHYVTAQDAGKGKESVTDAIPSVDGLFTDKPNLFLTSFYADCVPIFFLDSSKYLIGIVHAGWRGTVLQIGPRLLHRWMELFSADPKDIHAVIGPAIGSCCYEVDEHVVRHFAPFRSFLSEKTIIPTEHGKYRLDLKQINAQLLHKAGISGQHLEVTKWCTGCRTDLFFSHRKEDGKTGRMAAFIALKEEEAK